MVRKKLAIAVLALSALQADFASALGLGNVSVRSSLNQPLNAEIRLLDTGDLDPSQIKIALAESADFERAGVERDYFLGNLRFAVELDGRGGGVVRITTREPVVEPYLNFILETRWPSGRLLREYAVLLDLPTFSEGASVPFVPAGSSGLATVQQQARTSTPAPAPARSAAPADDWSMPAAGPGEYRVQQSDTMGKIAARLRPAGDISTEQTMLAIQRANPKAFIRNNVNLVKAGYVLRVPSADEMRSLSAGEATQELAAQNQAWRSGETYTPGSGGDSAAPQLDARAPAATSEEGGPSEQARLSIATPGDSAREAAGEGAASSGAGSEALRNELAVAQEGLESARRDNSELNSRLSDMERQVATLQRLITLKDEQLAALQTQGQEQMAADAVEPSAPESEAVEPTVEAPVAETSDETTAEVAPEIVPEPVAEPEVAEAETPTPVPVTPAPAAKPGLIEQLTANPLVPAAGAGLLALVLAGVLLARRRKSAEQEPVAFTEHSFDFDAPTSEDASASADLDNALISDEKIASADDFTKPAAEAPTQRVRSETGDAIAEAEIYIAYGRYQQAVDLLKGAIDAEPRRTDLRIKLLEVYLEMRDRDAFRRQFAELQGLGDESAVVQVKEMLSSVDGVSGWLDDMPTNTSMAAPVATVAAVSLAGGMALAADADQDNELELDQELAAGELDLDLDDDFAGAELALDDLAPSEEQSASGVDQFAGFELPDDAATDSFGVAPTSFGAAPTPISETGFSQPSEALPQDLGYGESAGDDGLELDLSEDGLDLDLDDMGGEGLEDLALDFTAETAPADKVIEGDEFDLAAFDEQPQEIAQPQVQEPNYLADGNFESPAETDALADLEADFGSLNDLDLELQESFEAPAAEIAPLEQAWDPEPAANAFEPVTNTFEAEVNTFESAPAVAEPEPFAADAFTSQAFTAEAVNAEANAADAPRLEGGDDEFDFLADADEVATKLDLARAYIDMGDTDGARDILGEVIQEGTEAQRQDASALLSRIG